MAKVPNGVETAENFNRSKVHKRYRVRTDDDIANVNMNAKNSKYKLNQYHTIERCF